MGGVFSGRRAPSRRAVLALPGAGLAVAGITSAAACSPDPPKPPAQPPADLAAAEAAARTERTLLASYDAALAAHPALKDLLAVLRGHHARHLSAIEAQVPAIVTPTPTGSAATPGATPAVAPALTGGDDAGAVAALADAERAAASAHRGSCLAVTTGLVPLLASLSASESCHADLLSIGR